MTKKISEHEGNKYRHQIHSCVDPDAFIDVDVYAVLVAFGVTCPARAHAVKKLLACGNRGKGSELQDLLGVEAAVARAIELQKQRESNG